MQTKFPALKWHRFWTVFEMFKELDILPGQDHNITRIMKALKVGLDGSSPIINCHNYPDFDYPVLSQVQICLNKDLQLIDCKKITANIYGTCPTSSFVHYPRDAKNYKATERAGARKGQHTPPQNLVPLPANISAEKTSIIVTGTRN